MPTQVNWRFRQPCNAMFYDGLPSKFVCAGAGPPLGFHGGHRAGLIQGWSHRRRPGRGCAGRARCAELHRPHEISSGEQSSRSMMHSMSVGPSPVSEGNLNGFRKFWSCSLVMSCNPFYLFARRSRPRPRIESDSMLQRSGPLSGCQHNGQAPSLNCYAVFSNWFLNGRSNSVARSPNK